MGAQIFQCMFRALEFLFVLFVADVFFRILRKVYVSNGRNIRSSIWNINFTVMGMNL